MRKALFSAVLAAAIGAGMAPASADDMGKDKIKSSTLKKVKKDPPSVKNNVTPDDYYTSSREMQMKISM
jgi:hypothetical protein